MVFLRLVFSERRNVASFAAFLSVAMDRSVINLVLGERPAPAGRGGPAAPGGRRGAKRAAGDAAGLRAFYGELRRDTA